MSNEEIKQQTEDEAFAKRVIDVVVSDLKADGRIKWALVGVFPQEEKKHPQIETRNRDGLP